MRGGHAIDILGKKGLQEFGETACMSPVKKVAGLEDFRLIASPEKPKDEDARQLKLA